MRNTLLTLLTLMLLCACTQESDETKTKIDPEGSEIVKKLFYPNGALKAEVKTVNGLQNGKYKEYYQDGSIKIEQNWVNGCQLGETKHFSQTNELICRIKRDSFIDGSNKRIRLWWFPLDSTQICKHQDYILIQNLDVFKASLEIKPNRSLELEESIHFLITIPNVSQEQLTLAVDNGAIIKKKQQGKGYHIRATKLGLVNLNVRVSINDTLINLNPMVLNVLE